MLSDEKLDELFVKQIVSVTKIVQNLPKNDAILPTCTRWFQIFEKSPPEEKFERNCILLLLHKQLNDHDTLCFPFNDVRQNDLKTVYQMMIHDDISDGYSSSSSGSISSSSSTGHKHEDSYQRLIRQNALLNKEFEALQLKLNHLSKRRELCLANIEDLKKVNLTYHKDIDCIKNIFSCTSVTALEKLTLDECPEYFSDMFKVLCENAKDSEKFRQLDKRLGEILRERINHSTREAMGQEMMKEYDALRAKFDKRYKKLVEDQESTQFHELSFYGMKCLTVLKKLFIGSFQGDKQLKTKVIAYLDKQYKALHKQ